MSSIPGLPTRGSNVTVVITRVHLHPLCMFVEFWGKFSQDRTADYESLAKDIQSAGYTFEEFEGNPCDECLVQINGTWYRSRIVSRNGSKYSVYLFDKGMTFSTTSNKLAWGKKEHFHLPPEVEFCVLANVLPLSPENRWSPVALEFLKSLCGKSMDAQVQDVLIPYRMFLLHIPCISTPMYEMGFAKKLFPEKFRDFVLMSLQSRSGAEMFPETPLISIGAGEPLHKQELFMYPELPAGTVETVIVTEVGNPQQVFCQLKVFSQELKKISEQLKQCCEGRMMSCVVGPEMIGFPCAARGNDGRWYRSVLQQVFPASKIVEVLNVDYGTKHFVQVENVRPLAAEFFRMPVVTYICSLHGISDKGVGWTSSQIDFLRNLLLCKTVIAKFEYQSISEGVHYVTLYGDENTNINYLFGSKEDCLLECGKALEDFAIHIPAYNSRVSAQQERNQQEMLAPGMTGEEKEVAEMLPAEDLSLNSSHLAVVKHASSPSEFWIQTQNYENEFNDLMGSLYHLYKESGKDVVRNPTVGLYCAARAEDGDFYRAVVSEVGETQIKVFFVDYGNTEVVDRINIRTLPDKFKKLPRLALKCALAGVGPKGERWSESASEFFIKAVTDKVLNICVMAKLDDCYVVLLTDPEAQNEKDLSTLMCNSTLAERAKTQRQPKAKISMEPAILPTTQPPDARHSFVYRNNGMSFQTHNTVGLANNERIFQKFKEHMFPIGSVLDVNVSYLESPNDFWCQLVQNAGHLKLLMHDIQARYAGSEFQPFVGTACVARHPDNGMWYRALVIHKHETPHVDILFVDYGQTEMVSIYDLRRICPEFLTLQGQAFRCSLLNPVDPTSAVNNWNDEATARFHNFVESAASNFLILKCTIYAVMYNDQKIVFNIVDLETPFESICTSMINLVKSATPKKGSGPSFRLDTYYYSTHNIKTGTEEQVTVTCVNSVSQFYCQLERNADVIKELNVKVNNLCCQLENGKLPSVFGTLCFAKYIDGQWYRGQIKAIKPAILVHFVDYGDTIEVDKSDLLPVPKEANDIMSVPVQAVVCSLSDVPASVPSKVNSWFETGATEYKFRALVVAREPDGKLLVELYHGHTQINSKIKKMFQIEMDTEEVVYHGWKAPVTSGKHAQKTPNAASKEVTEMENHTKTVKSRFSAPKPAHQMRDDTRSADVDLQSAPKISHQKVKAPPLELYRPPHQRQSCEKTQSNMGNGFEPAGAHVHPKNENHSTDTKQLMKAKSPGTGSQKGFNVEKLPKVADLPSNSVTLGMEADVYVSHCNNPLSFYVQLVREEDEIFSLAEKLNHPKSSLKTSDIKDLNQGDLVKAEFADDSLWYRAVVKETHTKMALIEFVDFGNTAMTPISNIGTLDKSFLELPLYSTHCMLSSAIDLNKVEVCDPEVVSAFKEVVVGNGEKVLKCRFIRQSGSLWEVSLEDNGVNVICKTTTRCSTNDSETSSETMEQLEEKPGQNFNIIHMPESLCSPHYQQQEFVEGQQLEVYITAINHAQSIWCQCADSEELDKLTLTVSEVVDTANKKSVYQVSLSPGSPCIALFSDDNLWYRAEVIDKDGDDLRVVFVDYGNLSQVNIADLREIPPDLVKIPPQAFLCKLEGFDSSCGSWDSRAVDELSALTADKLLHLTITRVERNEEKIKCYVQMKCDGQAINEVMKTWWKSSTAQSKPDEVGLTPSYEPPLQYDSAVKEGAIFEDYLEYPEVEDSAVVCTHPWSDLNEKQFSQELVEPHTTDEVKLVSSPKTSESLEDSVALKSFESLEYDDKAVVVPTMDIYRTESKDILPHDSGIDETMSSPLNDKGDKAVYTLRCSKNVGENKKDSEVEGASVMDTIGPDELMSPLEEELKDATNMSELQTTDVKEVDTDNMGSSFDVVIDSAHDRDDSETTVIRESSVTSVRAVKMVPRETVCPRRSTGLCQSDKDLKQIETALMLPSLVLSMQHLCDAPTDQGIEGEEGVPQEEVPCVTSHVKVDLTTEETLAHREGPATLFTDIVTAAYEPEYCRIPSTDMVEEVTCAFEEACLTDVCTEPSVDNEVTSAGDECLGNMTSEETVLSETLASSQHEMEFGVLSLQEETMSNKSTSVTEEETSALDEEELSALSSDSENETYPDKCSDMSSLVEQVTCLVGEICLTDCRDPREEAETQTSEPVFHTPPQQKEIFEDSDNSVLSEEMSSPDDRFEPLLSKITHLSLVISDGSDFLTVEQHPEE